MGANRDKLMEMDEEHMKLYNDDLETRFMEQCLDHCECMIGYLSNHEEEGKIEPMISKILQTIYILDYAVKLVGSKRANSFISAKFFSKLKLEDIYDNWNFNDDFKTKFDIVLSKTQSVVPPFNYNDVEKKWKSICLNIKERDIIKEKVDEDMVFQYKLIGSNVDCERRNLVRKIVDYEKTHENSIKEVKMGALIFAFTKKCRNKCRHCMIRKPNCEPFVLTKEKIKEAIDASYDYGIIACDCSGGEPLLEPEDVFFTFENSKIPQIFITSSANVAGNRDQLEKIVGNIWNAYSKNKEARQIAIQISLDKFHQEIILKDDGNLRENSPLIKVADMIEIILRKYPEINVNIFTLRSKNEFTLKYLLRELSRRDIKITDEDEAFWLWHELSAKVPEKGMDILQILLRFEVDGRIAEVHCGVQSLSELVYANALCPWEYLGSPFSFDDFKDMKEADRLWMESDMLFLEADGNVFLGGHLEGAWSLGTLAEESMERIIDSARLDPLVYYINLNFGQIVKWAEELEPNIRNELNSNPTGMSIMHRLFGDAAMRLYLTKRVILRESEKLYPLELVGSLNINKNIEDLKQEYSSKRLSRSRYY